MANISVRRRVGVWRSAFTLVELLVVIAIIGILIALSLPAVQAARESSRRAECSNHVKQNMLGFLNYHNAYKGFPNRYSNNGTNLDSGHGWGVTILPFIEEGVLHDQWNSAKSFFDPENEVVNNALVKSYVCPSAPDSPRQMTVANSAATISTTGLAGDYVVFHQIATTGTTAVCTPCNTAAPKTAGTLTPIKMITDGTSHTIMMSEQAGRPDFWLLGVKQPSNVSPNFTNPKFWGCWICYQSVTGQGYNAAGTAAGGACAMNCANSQGVYGFHPGGAQFGMCDGSVKFISENIPVASLIAYWSRDAGDQIDPNF